MPNKLRLLRLVWILAFLALESCSYNGNKMIQKPFLGFLYVMPSKQNPAMHAFCYTLHAMLTPLSLQLPCVQVARIPASGSSFKDGADRSASPAKRPAGDGLPSIFEKLTNPSLYTGAHKNRYGSPTLHCTLGHTSTGMVHKTFTVHGGHKQVRVASPFLDKREQVTHTIEH
jgi:hypothetical protein